MAACYDCGDRISPGLGIRYSVQTGSSIGQKSSRIYYRQVLLCQTCVLVRRRSDKQALFVMRIAGGIILAFLVMLWTIGHNAPSKHQVKSTDLTRRNSPSISPTPSTVPEIATSPQAVSSEGIFNAELFEPPSNCRTVIRCAKNRAPTASIQTGELAATSVTFSGVDVFSARYCKAL